MLAAIGTSIFLVGHYLLPVTRSPRGRLPWLPGPPAVEVPPLYMYFSQNSTNQSSESLKIVPKRILCIEGELRTISQSSFLLGREKHDLFLGCSPNLPAPAWFCIVELVNEMILYECEKCSRGALV